MDLVFEKIGLKTPKILLPNKGVDMRKWAVIACDQYTSQREYWEKVGEFVDGAPSTLHIILPEVYLQEVDIEETCRRINQTMWDYIDDGVLEYAGQGFVLIDRKTSDGRSRKGLVVALDLEKYDYTPESKSLIRATEGTYIEKLHPRVRIRENAPAETTHIIVLIDDPDKTVIEPLFKKQHRPLYDFDLMMGAGHIKAQLIDDKETIVEIAKRIERLADEEEFNRRYGVSGQGVILYAMGDGNHSFATAHAIWNRIKQEIQDGEKLKNHPARYALVELVNIHDPGLKVEPIHRIAFNVDLDDMLTSMSEFYEKEGSHLTHMRYRTFKAARKAASRVKSGAHAIPYVSEGVYGMLTVERPRRGMALETLEAFFESYSAGGGGKLTFIHGDDAVVKVASEKGAVGFIMPKISKHEIFRRVITHGVFPKKSISMGEADDKRFYIECRKIK